MTRIIWIGAIAGTLAIAAGAVALGYTSVLDTDSPKSRNPNQFGSSPDTRLMQFDMDKDGRLTRLEMDSALSSEFRAVDSNSDGRLDAAEIQRHTDARRVERNARYEAWRVKALAQGLDPKRPPFDRSDRDNVDTLRYADWNLDGAITPDEFGGRARSQFMRADRNGDGSITPDDLKRRSNNRKANSASRITPPALNSAHAA